MDKKCETDDCSRHNNGLYCGCWVTFEKGSLPYMDYTTSKADCMKRKDATPAYSKLEDSPEKKASGNNWYRKAEENK